MIDEARFPGRQGRLLFAYLVAEQGRPVPRDELAEALWSEARPPSWDKALTVIASKLRRVLADQSSDGGNALTSAFGCYRLDLPDGTWVDVIAAAAAVREAEEALTTGDVESAKTAAAQAASLLRPPFLPGEEGTWVDAKRREFADLRSRALSALADSCLRLGDAREAAILAEQTIALAPFRETGYRHLMEAHVAAGNRAEALRVYEQCRLLLAEELGTYPSPETESIYRGLLQAPPVAAPVAAASELPLPTNGADVGQAASRSGRRRLLVVLVCGTAVAAAAATATIELVTRGGPHSPTHVLSANSVAVFDPGNSRPSGQIPLGASPSAIASGRGSIWVANVDAHSVSRIDPAKRLTIETIPVGNGPAGIAFGGGFVWVTNGLDSTVSKIDPRTNTEVDRISVGNGPAGVAVDSRYVWVANSSDRTVTQIALQTDRPLLPAIPVGEGADGLAVGYDSVWVTSESSGSVTRIDERSRAPIASIVTGSGAGAVAVGLNSVWVANSLDGTVTRIDPATDTPRATIPVGDGPNGIAIVDGAVWVSNELGTLTRIDPATNTPSKQVTTGNRPEGIVSDSGSLFVPVRASGSGHSGGTLTVLTSSRDLVNVDPALAETPEEQQLVVLTNDGLTAFRRIGGTAGTLLVQDLAVSLPSPTDDGRSYSFQLRPGIHYSTGALVRPRDFRRAIERSLDLHGPGSAYFSGIVGARGCLAAPERPCDLSRGIVTEPGSNTVTFHLTSPDPEFLDKLALPAAFALPAGTPLHPRGFAPATGPYEVASFDPKRAIRLVRNPRFREWSQAAQPSGFPDVIIERFQGSPDARVASVIQGAADLATNLLTLSPAMLASVRTQHASQLERNPWGITWFLGLNTRVAPFDDVRVRRALNFAVDRDRLMNLALGPGFGRLTCQVLPPHFSGYQRHCPYTAEPSARGSWSAPDLARARRLVRSSGTAGQAVTVWIPKRIHAGSNAGRYIVSVLDSLGYKARFRFAADPYTAEDALRTQAGFYGWGPVFASSPGDLIDTALTCGVSFEDGNTARFCDPAIDREITRAQSLLTSDPEAATRLWAKIDRDITWQAPWVSFANGVKLEVISARLGDYQYSPQWGTLLDQLWVR